MQIGQRERAAVQQSDLCAGRAIADRDDTVRPAGVFGIDHRTDADIVRQRRRVAADAQAREDLRQVQRVTIACAEAGDGGMAARSVEHEIILRGPGHGGDAVRSCAEIDGVARAVGIDRFRVVLRACRDDLAVCIDGDRTVVVEFDGVVPGAILAAAAGRIGRDRGGGGSAE